MNDGNERISVRDFVPVAVIVVLITGWLLYGRLSEPETYTITADVPRAVAVYTGNAVVVDGLDIGVVEAVELDGDQVRLTLGIRDEFPLPSDARLEIVPSALLGEREVRIGPMWTTGDPRLDPGAHLGTDRTSIPVELDEALDAISTVIEELDGTTLARLLDVGARELDGRGQTFNDAVGQLGALTRTLSGSDASIDRIIESSGTLAGALAAKDAELRALLDTFATTSDVLAAESDQIARLVQALAVLTDEGVTLLAEHDVALRTDIDRLGRLGRALATNAELLPGLPIGITGFFDATWGAYRPDVQAAAARIAITPELVDQLEPLLIFLGVRPCIAVDVRCPSVLGPSDGLAGDEAILDLEDGSIGGLDLVPDVGEGNP